MQNNNQREQEASNPELEEVARLEEQLREAVAAEAFFDQSSGKLFQKLAIAVVNLHTKDIMSDKYSDDLPGYNNARNAANAYKDMLRKMQVAASPQRKAKIQEKLDNAE